MNRFEQQLVMSLQPCSAPHLSVTTITGTG